MRDLVERRERLDAIRDRVSMARQTPEDVSYLYGIADECVSEAEREAKEFDAWLAKAQRRGRRKAVGT